MLVILSRLKNCFILNHGSRLRQGHHQLISSILCSCSVNRPTIPPFSIMYCKLCYGYASAIYPTILFSLHPIYVHKIPTALHQQRTRPVPMAANLLVLFFLLLFLGFAAGRIPAVIVFGDSTVDPGNNDFLLTPLKANFPPYGCDFPGSTPTGRFCNGRLTTDLISASLGLLPAVPPYLDPSLPIQSLASGVSFASAGTGLDPATSQLLSVIPLMEEVELFREYKSRLAAHFGVAEAEAIVGEALYLVSIGTNDYIVNYFPMATRRSKEFTVGEFGEFLTAGAAEFVAALHALGARKVVFVGLAPIGCLPLERLTDGGGGCSEEHSAAARGFNDRLEAALARLDGDLPGLRLRFAPLYDFVANVIQNAQSYGFKNAEQGCCGTGELEVSFLCNKWSPYTCPDANQYAFFDAVHPSEKLNRLLTDYLLNTTLAEFI